MQQVSLCLLQNVWQFLTVISLFSFFHLFLSFSILALLLYLLVLRSRNGTRNKEGRGLLLASVLLASLLTFQLFVLIEFILSVLQPGKAILREVKGGYFKTVQRLFPTIRFANTKSTWSSLERRRNFFENFANKVDFDHQNPQNWYSQSVSRILAEEVCFFCFFNLKNRLLLFIIHQGAHEVLHFHKNNVTTALQDLFPNIGLETNKFPQFKRSFLFIPSLPF